MQGIIAFVVFGLIIAAIVVLIVINFTYKGIRQLREAAEERYERNQKIKEKKDKNPFGEDYFKSSDASRQQKDNGNGQRQPRNYHQKDTQAQQQEQPKDTTARRTTTSSGVTIIDDRAADKKIFDHSDGEYVEFEEV